jgi:hypothetical protein
MPTGPKAQKRPGVVIGNAVRVMRIATGGEDDPVIDDRQDAKANALGANGGKKRAALLDDLKEIRRRWANMPRLDSRSAEGIIDYDEHGLPH